MEPQLGELDICGDIRECRDLHISKLPQAADAKFGPQGYDARDGESYKSALKDFDRSSGECALDEIRFGSLLMVNKGIPLL